MKKLFGLRWRIYRSYFWAAILSSLGAAALIHLMEPLLLRVSSTGARPLILAACFFVVAAVVNLLFAYRESKRFKKKLDEVTAFTAVLARGNLEQRMEPEKDEIGRVSLELNRLAETMEKHVYSLQRLADDNEAMAGKVQSAAIIEERQRLARDLHDAVSQQLFALTMLSDAADATMVTGGTPTRDQIRDIANLAAQVQQEMRALLLHLRPVQLSNVNISSSTARLSGRARTKIQLDF